MQLIHRKDGDEQPFWKAGPFKVRLPFAHYQPVEIRLRPV